MATSPIYSWPEPDNTDLVKNGALAIRTLGDAIDTTMGTMVAKTIIDAKGDLIAGSAADTALRLAVGTNGQTLVADSTASTGLKYTSSLTGLTTITTSANCTINGALVGIGAGNQDTNVAFGVGALDSNTGGNYNTALGRDTLTSVTSGGRNTAVGSFTLNTTTGDQNTAIGQEAGLSLTTGSNNIMIGYASNASTATTSNSITLGNSSNSVLRCQVTSITALSDERDKKNIEPLEIGLDFVNELKPVKYDWNMRQPENAELNADGKPKIIGKVNMPDVGFIAQDLVASEDLTGLADYLQLTYRENPEQLEATQGRLIPILVKAIQELSAKVATLEANA